MFSWFKSSEESNFLKIDIHSHLLPALDDGVKSMDESISILKNLKALGFEKVITTPHIITDYYANTPAIIREALSKLRQALVVQNVEIQLEAAAEYFIDEHFLKMVNDQEELATFGDHYVLMETGFTSKPIFLKDLIFQLQSNGYKPILAHPERYIYLQDNPEAIMDLKSTGLLFQLNALSIDGYYSKASKKVARFLIENNMVDFLGSDIHNAKQLEAYQQVIQNKLFQKCKHLPLRNHAL